MTQVCDLTNGKCQPCEGGIPKLTPEEAQAFLPQVPDWQINDDSTIITRRFEFKSFKPVMSFMNAVAWIAEQEGHHPDCYLGYNYCEISYTTHALDGLSENDFICAAKIDRLLAS